MVEGGLPSTNNNVITNIVKRDKRSTVAASYFLFS